MSKKIILIITPVFFLFYLFLWETQDTTRLNSQIHEIKLGPSENILKKPHTYKGLVIDHSGAQVFQQPNTNSTIIGLLEFGEPIFILFEIEGWIYISCNQIEGWVKNFTIDKISVDLEKKKIVSNPDDLLVLINKQYILPSGYKPTNLVVPNVPFGFSGIHEKSYMKEEAAKALELLFQASKLDGIEIFAISGYRSASTQQLIFTNYVQQNDFESATKYSAFPGESEHQTGLAMDVTSRSVNLDLTKDFGETKEGIWVQHNAHKYGFIIRYPKGKEDITGYTYEPWHLRYIGKEAAKEIYENNITLEEYLNK